MKSKTLNGRPLEGTKTVRSAILSHPSVRTDLKLPHCYWIVDNCMIAVAKCDVIRSKSLDMLSRVLKVIEVSIVRSVASDECAYRSQPDLIFITPSEYSFIHSTSIHPPLRSDDKYSAAAWPVSVKLASPLETVTRVECGPWRNNSYR